MTDVDLGIDQAEFQQEKKIRLEELQRRPFGPSTLSSHHFNPLTYAYYPVHPPPKPLASAPTCHDIGGYMPGRLEFETEYENEAETLVKDMEFGKVYQFGGDQQPAGADAVVEVKPEGGEENGGEESDGDLELKLSILEMFNERYDRRVASKDLIFDRGLVNYKQVRRSLSTLRCGRMPAIDAVSCSCWRTSANVQRRNATSSCGPKSSLESSRLRTTKSLSTDSSVRLLLWLTCKQLTETSFF